ncbi:MAG TPA: hypothetical protein VHI51_08615 [Ktedonobacterales bacterium]|nr:hypothetical protein [Ktedonobacterales bacterium]
MSRAAMARACGIIAVFVLGVGVGSFLAAQVGIFGRVAPLAIAFAMYPLVGAVILAYRPGNVVGRLLVAIGFGVSTTFFSGGYLDYGVMTGHPLPASGFVDWLGNVIWPQNIALGLLLVLFFPTGRLPSPRWRWLLWAGVAGMALNLLSSAFMPGVYSGETTSNPIGIPALAPLLGVVGLIANVLITALALGALAAVFLRFWRSQGIERQQMKWFALGIAILVAAITLNLLLVPDDNSGAQLGFAIGFGVLPFSIGAAVLRARLYDIDIVINRALVYGLLTATLAAVFFGLTLGAQLVVSHRVSGLGIQTQQPIVIVLSTLLIAALFTPLRARIQRLIDRRFYRHKYDSARTLARFGQTLRTEVEMEPLCDQLVGAVEETMQPAHVTLWLRARDPASQAARADAVGR